MEKIGVIMEVNPFHNGHKYFLKQIRKIYPNEYLIAVITTTITQRGEISVLPKRVKTKMLLENGVDLVVELPIVFANQGGAYYGYYNVKILNELGIDKLVFGSESGDINTIKDILSHENKANDFKKGYLKDYLGNLKSNDILGLSYIKAVENINPNIKCETIKRIANNYNDLDLNVSKISSATAIRNNLDDPNIQEYLPKYSLENIMRNIKSDELVKILIFQLINGNQHDIFLSNNGEMISKIKRKFEEYNVFNKFKLFTYDELTKLCADKNNSKYKIQRVFINIIFQITEDEVNKIAKSIIKYKILGFSQRFSKEIKLLNDKLFDSYKDMDRAYLYNLNIDKTLGMFSGINYFDNYEKPIIK